MKIRKILGVTFITLLVVLAFLITLVNPFLEKRVKATLQTYINTSPDRPYDYDYQSMDVQVLRGNIWLKGVQIKPRQGITDKLNQNEVSFIIDAETDSVALTGLSIFQLLVKGAVKIDRILVSDVHFSYLSNSLYQNPDTTKKEPFVLKDVFSDKLKQVSIGCFELRNIKVFMDDIKTPDSLLVRFDSGRMLWRDIYTDTTIMGGLQPFTYSSLTMSARHFEGHMVKDHTIQVDSFSLSTADARIALHGVDFAPLGFSFASMAKQPMRSVNAISATDLVLTGLNFDSWMDHGRLDVAHVHANKPVIKVSMDHRWPKPMFERVFLSQRVRSIPIPIKIDTITAEGGYIYYREIFDDGKPPLEITFNDAKVEVINVCNDPKILAEHPDLVFTAAAKLLNSGQLVVRTVFPILDTLNSFDARIKIGAMPLTAFNPILEDQMKARLSGQMNTLAMKFNANKFGSWGDFIFDYTGLKLEFYKEKDTRSGKKEKKNWLINSLVNPVLRTDNTRSQPNFKSGFIEYSRPLDVSFFGLVWQSIKDGMVSTLVPGKSEKADAKRKAKQAKKEEKGKR